MPRGIFKRSPECIEKLSESKKGKKNPRWNGGTSEYPNHCIMKKNRLIKLKETNRICEVCSKEGSMIHHKDGTKTNHSIKNLLLVCPKCHNILHHNHRNRMSKCKIYFKMSIEEIAEKTNHSIPQTYSMIYSRNYNGKAKIKRLIKQLDRSVIEV